MSNNRRKSSNSNNSPYDVVYGYPNSLLSPTSKKQLENNPQNRNEAKLGLERFAKSVKYSGHVERRKRAISNLSPFGQEFLNMVKKKPGSIIRSRKPLQNLSKQIAQSPSRGSKRSAPNSPTKSPPKSSKKPALKSPQRSASNTKKSPLKLRFPIRTVNNENSTANPNIPVGQDLTSSETEFLENLFRQPETPGSKIPLISNSPIPSPISIPPPAIPIN
jgi:hypothetical protein